MNFARNIAQRIRRPRVGSFSATVTRIGIVSIALGITVLICSFSVLIGFKQAIKKKLFSFASHIEISKFSANESYQETPLNINTKFYQNYKNNPEIEHLQVLAHKAGIVQAKGNMAGIVLKGVGKDFNWAAFQENMVEGREIAFNDSSYSKEIIISKFLANQLNVRLGDALTVFFVQESVRARKLKVVGVYETGLEEFDKNFLIGDLTLVQGLNDWDKNTIGAYQVFVRDFERLDLTANRVFEDLDPELQLVKVTDTFAPVFDWLTMLDRNIAIVLFLIFVVVGFNIISVLLVLIMERTPMIGLLKTMGSSNQQIQSIFFYVGLNIIVRGLFWGNFIGLGLCFLQAYFRFLPLDPENYYISYVPVEISPSTVLMLNFATIIIVSLVVSIPTFILPRISPVKALKLKD